VTARVAFTAAALTAALLVSACPLPQPVPEVSRVDGGVVTSLRFRLESVTPPDPVVPVAKNCASAPAFQLSAPLDDPDTAEIVEARWFIDYDPAVARVERDDIVPSAADPNDTLRRDVPPAGTNPFVFTMPPLDQGTTHVVELIACSGGFNRVGQDPPGTPFPNRTPPAGFGVAQVYRWIFDYVDTGGRCQ
jgi:hypothetical protein